MVWFGSLITVESVFNEIFTLLNSVFVWGNLYMATILLAAPAIMLAPLSGILSQTLWIDELRHGRFEKSFAWRGDLPVSD